MGLTKLEFILLTEQINVVAGLSHSPQKPKHEDGKSEIFLVFPSWLQDGCQRADHHILI